MPSSTREIERRAARLVMVGFAGLEPPVDEVASGAVGAVIYFGNNGVEGDI